MTEAGLALRLLGPLSVKLDGRTVELPKSQKTRALLAYLAVTQRPHPRDRLCRLLWDRAEDPRSALRWSLSKLRALDDVGVERIRADRASVAFEAAGVHVDALEVRAALSRGTDGLSVDRLRELVDAFCGEFLDDLELPDCEEFQAWRVAMRGEFRALHERALVALVDRLRANPEDALGPARELVRLAPEVESNRATLIELLARCGRREEAEEHYVLGRKQIERNGVDRHELMAAWRAAQSGAPHATTASTSTSHDVAQEIRFCTSPDGVRIAFASVGSGPPLVKTANWMSHLEYDWKSPLWRHLARELSREHRLIRYDQRGNGLSDWDVPAFTLDASMGDLEAVVDAAGIDRFAMLGMSGGCRLAIAYAARHPQRLTHLVLYGGAARGWKYWNESARAMRLGLQAVIREGWGRDVPTFRQIFSTLFMPDASPEQMHWFNELQRVSTTPENAYRITNASGDGDVQARLGAIRTPTLVMHASGDAMVPLEEGRRLAAGIPNARFAVLDSRNHLLLDDEPAYARFMREIRTFLASDEPRGPP
jgi:pimeloyl-ACP methyl ester carboxylesterase/DNA-binding SARP family transcriptional activator